MKIPCEKKWKILLFICLDREVSPKLLKRSIGKGEYGYSRLE